MAAFDLEIYGNVRWKTMNFVLCAYVIFSCVAQTTSTNITTDVNVTDSGTTEDIVTITMTENASTPELVTTVLPTVSQTTDNPTAVTDNPNVANTTTDTSVKQNSAKDTVIKVGVLLMTNSTFPVDLRRLGPAIDKGIAEVKDKYGLTFQPIIANYSVWCYTARYTALGLVSDLYHDQNVRAFIGPACSYAVKSAGRLCEYLRVPMVTGLGDLAARNPDELDMFKTTAILSYNVHKLSVSVKELLKEFDWQHVSIIFDEDEVFYLYAGPSMVQDFEEDEAFPESHPVPFHRSENWVPEDTLKEASAHARIFVVLVNAGEFRTLMYHANRLGMAGGDYVFIAIQLAEIDWWGSYRKYLQEDNLDPYLKDVYESVLILTLINPVKDNNEFQDDIILRAQRDYGYNFTDTEPVHYFITSFYEAVLYLGAAFNRSIVENGNTDDGYSIARTFFNGTFEGLDQTVALDQYGTRIADFEVLDLLDADTESFQRVGLFYGSSRSYKPLPGVEVRFPNGVPVDMPICGYRNELCIEEKLSMQAILGIICGCFVFILLAVIILQNMYSRRKANMDTRWRIYWKDVEITKTKGSKVSGFSKSKLSVDDQETLVSNDDIIPTYGRTGNFNGNAVFVRRYNFTSIDLSSKGEAEMRKLYNLRHSNIETFVGACVDPGNIAVLSEICPRGSLMDIIANEGIELDWSFRHSLINDIIQGMKFLHGSDLNVHGRLRSSNCVVDSRFLLKIKGFAPKTFLELENKTSNTFMNPFKLLWTAPELLRESGWHPGTKAGDVYSFAIILQEIIIRGSPFETSSLSSEEILYRIKAPLSPPLRPDVECGSCARDLLDVMKLCWAEQKEARPTFDQIDSSLRKILKSKGSNIMDNLMRRMEQYANNLESLVEDRTNAYVEEKKRAEELLYRMLPMSVACALQHGKQVQPETFDAVTIYFSDIVGFTSLAGGSTPMQVVDLLNDLYTTFDAIIDNFQVYKVETIGDAYMCASGLPIRIGDKHVVEISNMAIAIRESVKHFKIRHKPGEALRVRIGLHSGSVVAGVVGLTMPRYCLFGDTVNTASRMESTGEAMKIHVSETTMVLLKMHGGYATVPRGHVEVKGKGSLQTFWLLGHAGFEFEDEVEAVKCPEIEQVANTSATKAANTPNNIGSGQGTGSGKLSNCNIEPDNMSNDRTTTKNNVMPSDLMIKDLSITIANGVNKPHQEKSILDIISLEENDRMSNYDADNEDRATPSGCHMNGHVSSCSEATRRFDNGNITPVAM